MRLGPKKSWLFWVAVGGGLSLALFAEDPPSASPPALPPSVSALPPALPTVSPQTFKSPIVFFRELLEMSPADQSKALEKRSEASRKILIAKVEEYLELDAETRELRLKTTEMRWYLKTLLPLEPRHRAAILLAMPATDRALVAPRLAEWSELSPGWQKEIMDHERTMDWLRRVELAPAERRKALMESLPQMRERVTQWQVLPKEQRQRLATSFQKFFQLSDRERRLTLGTLPETERLKVAPALGQLAALPEPEREECLQAFDQIAAMAPARREQFFVKAAQWRRMTSRERQTWKNLVANFPPLPPGLPVPTQSQTSEFPPLPPGLNLPTMPPLPFLAEQ